MRIQSLSRRRSRIRRCTRGRGKSRARSAEGSTPVTSRWNSPASKATTIPATMWRAKGARRRLSPGSAVRSLDTPQGHILQFGHRTCSGISSGGVDHTSVEIVPGGFWMRAKYAIAAVAAALLAAAVPAVAHHSFAAEFDASKPITVKGTVTAMDWVNPHSHLRFDVKAEDGTVEHWTAECLPPNGLYRQGWRKTSVKA